MANSLTGNPIFWDSTSSSEVTGKLRIQGIVWSNPTTASHAILVEDSAGKDLWAHTWKASSATHIQVTFPEGLKTSGIKLTTLGSGKVFVYRSRL